MLSDQLIAGRVVQWKGSYGWIEAIVAIEHSEINRHKGRIFVHAEDIRGKWKLKVGSIVEFYLYLDSEGLGASEVVSRQVVRLTIPSQEAKTIFGVDGELVAAFEDKKCVTLRIFSWVLLDGTEGNLGFFLVEVWGRAECIVDACVEIAEALGNEEFACSVDMLIPETRTWQLDMKLLRAHGSRAILSKELAIVDPMACHGVAIGGTSSEVKHALHALIEQICDKW